VISAYTARVTELAEDTEDIYPGNVWVTASGVSSEVHVRLPAGEAPRIGDILHIQVRSTDTD
jgi:hypothetical protein